MGTSFSAPLVAGGAALLMQVDPAVDQSKAAELLSKAQPMTAAGMGRGRLNLPEAVSGAADTISPSVSMSAPTGGGSLFGSILMAASASDNVAVAGVKFLLDGNPLGPEITAAPFEQMWTTTAVANGSHVLTALARDRAGNATTSVVNVTVSNDTAPPSVTLISPTGGESLAGTVAVTAAASDDLEVARVRFSVDGTPIGEDTAAPFEAAWTTTSVANGSHVVAAIAYDTAGHATTASAVVTVANDNGAPTVTLTSPTGGATLSGTVPLTATVSDDIGVASVTFLVDGAVAGVETPAGRSWNTATVANGAHVVSVVARDAAGHETTGSAQVTVQNDLQAPAVALTTPVEGATVAGVVGVLASATDDIGVVGVQFKVDGALIGGEDIDAPYQALWNTVGASNGSHVLSAVARDAAGHETTTSVSVVVGNDTAPPTVALTSPGVGATLSGMVSLVATASDDFGVASVQFLVDGIASGVPMTAAPYAWSWNTDVANGPHTLTAVARDASGHETSASVVVNVANDHEAPTVTLLDPVGGATLRGTVMVGATAADDIGVVSVEFLVDGSVAEPAIAAAPYQWSWNTASVMNGSHTVTAVASDAAGHATASTVEVTVDNNGS